MVELPGALGSLMGGKHNDIVAVEFSGPHIRLCIVKVSPTKKEVIALIEKDIQSLKDEDVVLFIHQALSKYGVKEPRVIYIVPSELVITKNIELPSRDHKEINDIVNLQASRHTPYGREEIAIDYITIGITAKNYTKILLVIVNRDVVRRNFELLKKSSLEPEKISFFSESLAKSFSKNLKLDKEQIPICLLHIDTSFSVCNIILRDTIIFVRSIPVGIQHLTVEKEMQQERFLEEIKQSLEVYRNENIDNLPSRIIITGAIDEVKDLAPLVNDAVKIPTENVSYSDYFSFSEDAGRICVASKLSSFAGIISAAVFLDELKINLVPEEAQLKRVFQERSQEFIQTGMLLFVTFVIICLSLLGRIYVKNQYINKLNGRFIELHKQAEVIEKDFSRVKLIRNYLARRGHSLEILGEFYKLLPKKIRITEIRFDKKKNFTFKGTADSTAEALSFAQDLNKSDYFTEAKTRYTSKRKEGEKEVADFEIVAPFAKEE